MIIRKNTSVASYRCELHAKCLLTPKLHHRIAVIDCRDSSGSTVGLPAQMLCCREKVKRQHTRSKHWSMLNWWTWKQFTNYSNNFRELLKVKWGDIKNRNFANFSSIFLLTSIIWTARWNSLVDTEYRDSRNSLNLWFSFPSPLSQVHLQ